MMAITRLPLFPKPIMQQKKFFVSFWNLCLENLTKGSFIHRCLTPEQAKTLIEQAQQNETLLCVSNDDLLALYNQKKVRKYQDLCNALRHHHSINLSIQDFMLRNEESDWYSTAPLQIVEVQGETKLLVITCNYMSNQDYKDESTEPFDINAMFVIAPDSVKFHLLEAIAPLTA
jgi:hypothetical protein